MAGTMDLSRMADAYAEHFGFAKSPFDSNADSPAVFASRAYVAASAELFAAIEQRESIILLTGESGTGKTTVWRSTISLLPGQTFVSEVVDPTLTTDDLLTQIVQDFGAQSGQRRRSSGSDLPVVLAAFLDEAPATARALVVIDDAQELEGSVIQQLHKLASRRGPAGRRLQILFVGLPSLVDRLQEPDGLPLGALAARRIDLEKLGRDEVLPYIEHRLAVAKAAHANIDDLVALSSAQELQSALRMVSVKPAAVRHLAALSRGTMRPLNLLCDRALEVAFERLAYEITPAIVFESARRLDARVPLHRRVSARPVRTLAAFGAVSLAAAAWFWGDAVSAHVSPSLEMAAPAMATAPPSPELAIPALVAPVTPPPLEPVAEESTTAESALVDVRAAAAPDTRPESGRYLLKLGSFKSEQNAANAVAMLKQMNLPAFGRQNGPWHLVFAGPFATAGDARSALTQVPSEEFPNAQVSRESPKAHSQAATPSTDAAVDAQSSARAN
jgi:general secretion pathway protein A